MSDVPHRRGSPSTGPFSLVTVIAMLAAGILAFMGMLLLGAFAPDLRSGHNGGVHALSNSATGLSGIVRLIDATGRQARIIRSVHDFGDNSLLVVTPDHGWDDLGPILQARRDLPTLLVFPKWETSGEADHEGWVEAFGLRPPDDPDRMLSPEVIFPIGRRINHGREMLIGHGDFARNPLFVAPRLSQVITGAVPGKGQRAGRLTSLITNARGEILLARYGDGPLYLLADPDLLSNAGIADPHQAVAALAMLDWLNVRDGTTIAFDVTMNGLGHAKSPLKLAFTPPFLGMTIVLALTVALLGWHAVSRFGPVRPRPRAIAFGKEALVGNSAALVRRARREAELGSSYVQSIREQAARAFALSPRLQGAALDAHLDGLGGKGRFTALAQAVERARDRASLAAAARALHDWLKESG